MTKRRQAAAIAIVLGTLATFLLQNTLAGVIIGCGLFLLFDLTDHDGPDDRGGALPVLHWVYRVPLAYFDRSRRPLLR